MMQQFKEVAMQRQQPQLRKGQRPRQQQLGPQVGTVPSAPGPWCSRVLSRVCCCHSCGGAAAAATAAAQRITVAAAAAAAALVCQLLQRLCAAGSCCISPRRQCSGGSSVCASLRRPGRGSSTFGREVTVEAPAAGVVRPMSDVVVLLRSSASDLQKQTLQETQQPLVPAGTSPEGY